jgi:lipopolysaccharide transport system permease protein
VYELVRRDMKLRYKRSALGLLWSLLNPLSQLLVFTFLFRRVIPLDIPNYPLFAFTGVLAWSWFSSSLSGATTSVTTSRELVHRPGFPVAVLPAVSILSNLVHFLIALALLLIVLIVSGHWISPTVLSLPMIVVLQFFWTLSLAYFFATVNVWFRDTAQILSLALTLGMFLTPIYYRAQAVPEAFQPLYRANPMLHLVEAYRAAIIHGRWPPLGGLLLLAAATLFLLWLGVRIFTNASYRFSEEL